MDVPPDLPLALLALQRGLIDRQQLLAGWHAWAARPDRPLGELLVERRLLAAEQHRELQRLLQAGPTPPGETPGPPDSEGPLPVTEAARSSASDGPQPSATCPDADPDARYQRTGLHAEGGMGSVWLARDGRLDRVVALKELQPRWQ